MNMSAVLISTRLQPGDGGEKMPFSRFNGFSTCSAERLGGGKPLKRLEMDGWACNTRLKPGANMR
jgi:hypothetical protein